MMKKEKFDILYLLLNFENHFFVFKGNYYFDLDSVVIGY